jgi:hypothetical protein
MSEPANIIPHIPEYDTDHILMTVSPEMKQYNELLACFLFFMSFSYILCSGTVLNDSLLSR